jgi:hypothetical protein
MLNQLIHLATDLSAEGRRQLLHAVTDLFLIDAEPSAQASEHFAEIADTALKRMQDEDRAAYAARVAPHGTLPRVLARRLASDPSAAVACVVLKLSPLLTDADLAAIAVTHSAEHLRAIAERPTLSPTVTDALIKRGDEKALQTVSANEGARFSDRGMSDLLKRSEADPVVLQNLKGRLRQLSPGQAKRVQAIVEQMVAIPGGPSDGNNHRREAQQRRLEVKLLLAELQAGQRSLDNAVELLASEDRAFDLARLIGAVAGLQDAQVLKVLLEPDVSGIAVACRSIGLSTGGFKAVLRLRAARLDQTSRAIERDCEAYEDLPQEVSEHTIRFLKVRAKVA